MIIFLPTKIKPTGGSSSFALKLQTGLQPKKHEVIFKFQPTFDLLLVNSLCPLRYLLYAKLIRVPIIQRLDGVYYPMSIAHLKYRFYNLPLQIILHFFVRAVIYQSRYSKICCDKFLGGNRYISHHLIYNGVDTRLFSNHGSNIKLRNFPQQPIFITASRFRRTDQIVPLIEAFFIYQKKYQPAAQLIIIGNFESSVAHIPFQHKTDSSLHFLGAIPNHQLPNYYRSADIFLFTHLNPPCPNNIIEAMACGLPICGVADGAMSEITSPGLNSELVPVDSPGFFQPRTLDINQFAVNLNKIMLNHKHYSTHSRLIASDRFTLTHMINQYLSVFNQAVA